MLRQIRVRLVHALLLVAVLAASWVPAPKAQAQSDGPSLSLSPSSGPPPSASGSLGGGGWCPDGGVEVGGDAAGSGSIGRDGSLGGEFYVTGSAGEKRTVAVDGLLFRRGHVRQRHLHLRRRVIRWRLLRPVTLTARTLRASARDFTRPGLDHHQHAIEKAREGIFPANIAADVTAKRLDSDYFVKVERGYQVTKSIREMIISAPQNIIMDPPFTKLDLVSCRNLLIYLTPELQKKLLPLFHYSLNRGGFLF